MARNSSATFGVGRAMLTSMRTLPIVLVALALAACSGGAVTSAPPSSAEPSTLGEASASPDFGAIDHLAGATDVVLRFEQGGGFVMPAFLAVQAPIFTLYGDGTVIFRNPTLDSPPPVGSITPMNPFRTAKLTEDQVQDLLAFALGEGGLGVARPEYTNDQIADAPTSVFTIAAGGLTKSVSVYALGLEIDGGPDAPARAAFARLAERLQDFDQGGAFATDEYVPERYRGVLLDGGVGAPDAKPWPWPEVKPADFVSKGDPNAFPLPTRAMTVAEVEALGVTPYRGGFQGATLIGPDDGKAYSFSLRPLLPDETG